MTESEYPKKAGIYKLTCRITDKSYIGKSVNINRRLKEHKSYKKSVCYFQSAIIKHGWDSFDVEILEIFENFDKITDNNHLLEREAYYIEFFDSTNKDKGYNICKHSNDVTGTVFTKEHKEKIRQARLGKTLSDETKEKLRKIHTGRVVSNETKEKMSKSALGKVFTEGHKKKLSQAKLGKPMHEKTKKALKEANFGKSYALGRKHSKETKEKISKLISGTVRSEETKEKMRQSKLGKPRSDETKEKIRNTLKAKSNKV